MICPHHDNFSVCQPDTDRGAYRSEKRGGERGWLEEEGARILKNKTYYIYGKGEEEGEVHQLKQNTRQGEKWERKKTGWKVKQTCKRRVKLDEGGGAHHSVAMSGWYLHLPVICTGLCKVERKEEGGGGVREEKERENLYPFYLWASSPAVQELAFQECLIFKSLISACVLSIAVLYFYMSFACSSSNLALSGVFFYPSFLRFSTLACWHKGISIPHTAEPKPSALLHVFVSHQQKSTG